MLEKAIKAFEQGPETTIKDFNVEFYSPFSTYGIGFKDGTLLSDRDNGRYYALHLGNNKNEYIAVSQVHTENKPQIQQSNLPKGTFTRRNSKLCIARYEHNGEVCVAYKLVKNSSDDEPIIFIIGEDINE